jgi:hypothetical protein
MKPITNLNEHSCLSPAISSAFTNGRPFSRSFYFLEYSERSDVI